LLEVSGLSARYGPVWALRDVSLEVRAGELVALIGANGAGKSTLLRTIAGLWTRPGRVTLEGRDVTGPPPEAILRSGIALVPERRRVFADLTVLDNLELGGYALPRGGDFRRRLDAGVDDAYRLFPVLHRRRAQLAAARSRAASSRCSPSGAR
jgi:branched-chain amino acid transport system ATP-binding protein